MDKIDLLTVVEHELDHVLALEDLASPADLLMNGVLQAGLRRRASAHDLPFELA